MRFVKPKLVIPIDPRFDVLKTINLARLNVVPRQIGFIQI